MTSLKGHREFIVRVGRFDVDTRVLMGPRHATPPLECRVIGRQQAIRLEYLLETCHSMARTLNIKRNALWRALCYNPTHAPSV